MTLDVSTLDLSHVINSSSLAPRYNLTILGRLATTTMLIQATLFATLLCLNTLPLVNAGTNGNPAQVLEQSKSPSNGASTVSSNHPVTDLTDASNEVVIYDVLVLVPPKAEKPGDNNEKLLELQHLPSDQGGEYEELPPSCCGCLCPKRRVQKFRNPRFSTTAEPERRISHTASWITRQTSTSTTSEDGEGAGVNPSGSTTPEEIIRTWSSPERHRSSRTDDPKTGAPPTSGSQSDLGTDIPEGMTQPELDGNHHAPSSDTPTATNSGQQGMPGTLPETLTPTTGT